MDEQKYLSELRGQSIGKRIRGYLRLSGPGYMQSAMTLGGGSIAACVLMGSMLGYELLWVQTLAIFLGYFLLAAVAKQTCATGEPAYDVFWNRLHPALAILWAVSSLVATVLWHIPQYGLTANGLIVLFEGVDINLDTTPGRVGIGVVVLPLAFFIVYLYGLGARGLRLYERAVKTLVWAIVIAFAVAAFATGIDWSRLFFGITGITFIQNLIAGRGVPDAAVIPIVGGLAAAVGINMVFLYPYSILNKKWGKEHKELAYFDLMSGMVVPFLIATSFMMVAVANTIGPAPGEVGAGVKDMREVLPVLASTLGGTISRLIIGLGMAAVGFSTIITHMLAAGFIGCELFGFDHRGRAKLWFSLLPAIGVIGVMISFPWYAAVTASSLAACLMPAAVLGFLILHNMKSYLGDERPEGLARLGWNVVLMLSVLVLTIAGAIGLWQNYKQLTKELELAPAPAPAATADEADIDLGFEREYVSVDALDVRYVELIHEAMATDFHFYMYGSAERLDETHLAMAGKAAFDLIDAIEAEISSWRETSDTSRVNREGADHAVEVGGYLWEVLLASKEAYDLTNGAFDVTVGPLLDLWRNAREAQEWPEENQLKQALARVGLNHVVLESQTVQFRAPGMRLDFGGIGKGYALDKVAELLKERGVTQARIHGGTSTVLALGAPYGLAGWTVEIPNPYNRSSEHIDEVLIRDEALSTSALSEEYLNTPGGKYGHIYDPRTGQPAEDVISATAITRSGTLSDALSTAFFVMGIDGTEAYCQAHPETRAILVLAQNGELQPLRINFDAEESF
jgi:thiamine biosynthesis lipoprotein ApbE/Mn2+/Fe2+ NRAMP family transporter